MTMIMSQLHVEYTVVEWSIYHYIILEGLK